MNDRWFFNCHFNFRYAELPLKVASWRVFYPCRRLPLKLSKNVSSHETQKLFDNRSHNWICFIAISIDAFYSGFQRSTDVDWGVDFGEVLKAALTLFFLCIHKVIIASPYVYLTVLNSFSSAMQLIHVCKCGMQRALHRVHPKYSNLCS